MPTIVPSDFGDVDIDTGRVTDVSSAMQIFNPALKGTDEGGNPIVILVAAISPNDREFWCIDQNGKVLVKSLRNVTTDWRYDMAKEAWVDTNGESLEVAE